VPGRYPACFLKPALMYQIVAVRTATGARPRLKAGEHPLAISGPDFLAKAHIRPVAKLFLIQAHTVARRLNLRKILPKQREVVKPFRVR
jgi:hypothetical protein